MNCPQCNSKLFFSDGLYICTSCGNKFHPNAGLEFSDVFIAYIENDCMDHRTKDSIICNEIYHNLENAGIKTFYERVALSNAWGEEYEAGLSQAFQSADIIIIFGTSHLHFEMLLDKYRDKLAGKKLFPVYSDMDAYDMPAPLSNMQALNYGNIGAVTDLKNNILVALGRGSQIDTTTIKTTKDEKKRSIIIGSTIIGLIALIIASLVIVFATPLVLPQKKYDKAQSYIYKEQYADAILMLSKIPQYENSQDLLNSVYNKYSGYYQTPDADTGFHIVFWDGAIASVQITQAQQNGIITISETTQPTNNIIELSYNDSQNNTGKLIINLENTGLRLTIEPDTGEDASHFFTLSEKSDKPIQSKITGDTIREWLKKPLTKSELKSKGYDLIFENPLYKNDGASQYLIENTDIHVALILYDIRIAGIGIGTPYDLSYEPMAFGYSAPAEILIPDMINQSTKPFVRDGVLYLPNHLMTQSYVNLDFYIPYGAEEDTITKEMQVCCTSKELLGEELWEYTLKQYIS